ncbi:MAG: efflux RND transporter permease subunit, partial [Bradyrhizobium sp.]
TLLAFVLAIGLVVDDAIVVVENIYRHIEDGMTPFNAALKGAREITGPVIAMTITLAAVYAPIGFVSGLTGALFREFAFTLAGSVIVSGFIALTLSPMMCSRLLKPPREGGGGFAAFLDRRFEALRVFYTRRLDKTLNFRALTVLILAGVLVLTGIMFMSTPKELAPTEDQGAIFALIKAPQYSNLDYMERMTDSFTKAADTIPEKDHVFVINGSAGVHQGLAGLILKPWGDRKRNEKQILTELQPKLAALTGGTVIGFSPPSLPGSTGGPPVQFVLRTIGDYKQLADVMAKLKTAADKSGLFIFTDSDLKFDTPQLEFKIDAAKANRLGISMQDIGSTLATMLGG